MMLNEELYILASCFFESDKQEFNESGVES